ncbi:glycoside hydrolase family protein [Pseudomonas saudimassiliensis]|uniref:Glycoside hydrolase family protein n=1 Tax=Pseudomonas saudimassiliensis TaxID=1461581 RepID=A0A078M4S4_9PSED|nr:glycosyltransferase family 4 protein [Pseudomonas saudimassiliensis]CEA01330.1 glycoside hydrolase family protein [Pseudomonas saudimassiliensis]CEF25478.1 glycoside hydrolase family protein [Pseudomonas saudimassiliensis]
MKVALVVDWLTVYSGAERVVEQILQLYPDADLFSLIDFLQDDQRAFLNGKQATTSFLQRMPFARTRYRSYLPLMPLAIEQFDLSGYDLIISSSHAVAKGVLTGPDQLHICYIHSPVRYAWDLQHQYLMQSGLNKGLKNWIARWSLHYIRNFDARSSLGVNAFIANSEFIARRVQKCYRRPAEVVYPPVNITDFIPQPDKQDFYVAASRMVPYKRMDLIAQAFRQMPERKLVIIGDGPDLDKVRAVAAGASNITVTGFLPFPQMRHYMQQAKAFVFAAEEDFGITPVEAMACGTPVIAYGKGGALETVVDGRTGFFFPQQTPESLIQAVEHFEQQGHSIRPEHCREQAEHFSIELFRERFSRAVDAAIQEFNPNPNSTLAGV